MLYKNIRIFPEIPYVGTTLFYPKKIIFAESDDKRQMSKSNRLRGDFFPGHASRTQWKIIVVA